MRVKHANVSNSTLLRSGCDARCRGMRWLMASSHVRHLVSTSIEEKAYILDRLRLTSKPCDERGECRIVKKEHGRWQSKRLGDLRQALDREATPASLIVHEGIPWPTQTRSQIGSAEACCLAGGSN